MSGIRKKFEAARRQMSEAADARRELRAKQQEELALIHQDFLDEADYWADKGVSSAIIDLELVIKTKKQHIIINHEHVSHLTISTYVDEELRRVGSFDDYAKFETQLAALLAKG